MHPSYLIIGGCRSGKSSHALELGLAHLGARNLFIATCVPGDDEMAARVKRHRQERDPRWQTVEEPIRLPECLTSAADNADLILIDCLTLWISNLMALQMEPDYKDILARVDGLCAIVTQTPCPIIVVTNEVGAGIVPENPLARRFRDLVGWANQKVATACRQVIWMVAGIPVKIRTTN